MEQVRIYPYLDVLLYGLVAWPRHTRGQTVVAGLFVGATLGASVATGGLAGWLRAAEGAPARAWSNGETLLERRAESDAAEAARFGQPRLAAFAAELAAFEQLRVGFGWHAGDELYVLGDDPVPYLVAGQVPPYNVNSYNSSPLAEQLRTVAWLEVRKPRFVLWDPADDRFDDVPHHVRLPLIYTYVIGHYLPRGTAGRFEILIRAPRPETESGDFWRRRLGDTVDLGHLVRRSDPDDYGECESDACAEMLVVETTVSGRSEPVAEIQVQAAGERWKVRFRLDRDRRRYLINPRRLWFWTFARAAGPLRLESATAGVTVRLDRRAAEPEVLY